MWNQLAGGHVLPNREGGKLRYTIGESEQGWRVCRSMRTGDESLMSDRPLTTEEHRSFRKHSRQARRWNKVVAWSRGMGTLQYLLAPAAMIWSGILLFTRKTRNARLVVGPFCLTNVASIASMLYRGYLND